MKRFKTTSMRTLAVGAMLLAVTFMSACTKKVTTGKAAVIYRGTATESEECLLYRAIPSRAPLAGYGGSSKGLREWSSHALQVTVC